MALSLRFDNTSDRTVELDLSLTNTAATEAGESEAVIMSQSWAGLVNTSLGLVEPGDTTIQCVGL